MSGSLMPEARNADTTLGELRAALKALGLDKTTDIFVTADHGFTTVGHESATSPSLAIRGKTELGSGFLAVFVAGIVIGYPTFRLRGHYFALSMLAYPMALLYVFVWLGYQEVPLPMKREAPTFYMQFSDYRVYIALAVGLLVVSLLISLAVERSRFGMSLTAIKQNEPAAEAAGIDTLAWRDGGAPLRTRRERFVRIGNQCRRGDLNPHPL